MSTLGKVIIIIISLVIFIIIIQDVYDNGHEDGYTKGRISVFKEAEDLRLGRYMVWPNSNGDIEWVWADSWILKVEVEGVSDSHLLKYTLEEYIVERKKLDKFREEKNNVR